MKKNELSAWLDRACASVGMTFAEVRQLWIAVRRGDDTAKVRLNTLLRTNPGMAEVFKHLSKETRDIRRSRGLKTRKGFGRPELGVKGSFARLQSNRVNGVNSILQGGHPSLGKASK